MPAKKQEGITINTEELSTKIANLFQIKVFFFNTTQRWGEEGQARGRGREKKGKMPASNAYEFAEHPPVSCNWLLFWKCICTQWKSSSLFQTPQIYSNSNGNKAVWMPKPIALQNMTALQANSGFILFTLKLTEFFQNSIFTYRKYSKQCSPVFNSRHNNDMILRVATHQKVKNALTFTEL